MKSFIETNDLLFGAQLRNFWTKLVLYAVLLGFTSDETDEAKADSDFWDFCLDSATKVNKFERDFSESINLLRHGNNNQEFNGLPQFPTIGTPPPLVSANIQLRFSQKAAKVKASPKYTKAIGLDLGIEAPHTRFVPSEGKPILTIKINAGHPEIKFLKSNYDGLEIYKDSGTGYVYFATSIRNVFVDQSPLPTDGTSALWKYKAIYLSANKRVGAWSDEVSVTVF